MSRASSTPPTNLPTHAPKAAAPRQRQATTSLDPVRLIREHLKGIVVTFVLLEVIARVATSHEFSD